PTTTTDTSEQASIPPNPYEPADDTKCVAGPEATANCPDRREFHRYFSSGADRHREADDRSTTDERGTTEIPDELSSPIISVHPLAALGIHPTNRQHARGETPKHVEPPAPTEQARHSSSPPSPSPAAAPEVVPLAQLLKSEPPPPSSASPTPNESVQARDLVTPAFKPEQLLEPLAAAMGTEMLAQLGPDFKQRVMDLVAQRIAATVAEQMLQSFGQSAPPSPSRRPRAARVALAKQSDLPDAPMPPKRQRKRIAKH
ncbi:MAG TPA: hypothetical protein VIV60_18530, partial [Polyangiaceae bacterium]